MMRLKKNIILYMILIINYNIVQSQVTQEWTTRYNGNGIDGGNGIVTDNIGNVYVTGSANGPPNENIATIKYSPSGQEVWLKTYNGIGNGPDGGNAIKIDNDGNLIVAGESTGIGTSIDITTIKYSSSGDQLWVARYTSAGNYNDFTSALTIDRNNNIYITGSSNDDYVTIKYNSEGEQQWASIYGRNNNQELAFSIAIDISGNVFVTGYIGNDSTNSIDIATIKYNSLGIQEWIAIFSSSINENDYGLDIGVDNSGNVYVCGGSQGNLHYDDYIIVKYDSSGTEQWYRRYNGSDNFLDQARSLAIDNSNNIYVTGYSTYTGTGYDFTTIKYNTNGDQLWLKRYNNGLNDMANKIVIDEYGNLYVTGQSDGNGTGYDYATVKYDSSGNQLWVKRYDYSGQFGDYPSALALDNSGNVFLTGSSDRDYLTIKYSQLTGVSTNFSQIPREFKLEQNYPNPFNPVTNLGFGISDLGFVSLRVYDVLGNEVATLVNEKKSPGSYRVEFNGENFPSGIYFYKLEVNGIIIASKKMLLLK